jgi:hypothetical protein
VSAAIVTDLAFRGKDWKSVLPEEFFLPIRSDGAVRSLELSATNESRTMAVSGTFDFVAVLWQFQFENSSETSFKPVPNQLLSPCLACSKCLFTKDLEMRVPCFGSKRSPSKMKLLLGVWIASMICSTEN